MADSLYTFPDNLYDHVTCNGRYEVVVRIVDGFVTDGGETFKVGMPYAAYQIRAADMVEASEELEAATAAGKCWVPFMKCFRSRRAATDWLRGR